MSKPIVAGNPNPIFQGNVFDWSLRTGYAPQTPYKGYTPGMMQFHQTLLATGQPHNFDQTGSVSTITFTGGSNIDQAAQEIPVDSWQMPSNELQKDLYEHPNALAIEAAAAGNLALVKAAVRAYNEFSPPASTSNPLPAAPVVASGSTIISGTFTVQQAATQLYNLLIRESTHFPVSAPVLKHTQTVSEAYNYLAGQFLYMGQEQIYTTAQLLVECANFPRPLPDYLIGAINSIPVQAAAGYTWGWRKKPPGVSTGAQNKVEINTEYELGLWTTFSFPPYSP